jgi:hypothetical protein
MADSQASASIVTEISYCPHLNLYHYKKADGADYFFDTPQLEIAIDAYIKAGETRQADFMIMLTALARRYPHQVMSFNDKGECVLRDMPPAAHPDASVGVSKSDKSA